MVIDMVSKVVMKELEARAFVNAAKTTLKWERKRKQYLSGAGQLSYIHQALIEVHIKDLCNRAGLPVLMQLFLISFAQGVLNIKKRRPPKFQEQYIKLEIRTWKDKGVPLDLLERILDRVEKIRFPTDLPTDFISQRKQEMENQERIAKSMEKQA